MTTQGLTGDQVLIEGLVIETYIGVYAWERQVQQRLLLDLRLGWDNRAAAQTDDLRKALDYSEVCRCVQRHLASHQYGLIETLAEAVAALLLEAFAITGVALTVRKPGAITNAVSVGVSILRLRGH